MRRFSFLFLLCTVPLAAVSAAEGRKYTLTYEQLASLPRWGEFDGPLQELTHEFCDAFVGTRLTGLTELVNTDDGDLRVGGAS